MRTRLGKRAFVVGALVVVAVGFALARFGPWTREFWMSRSTLLELDRETQARPGNALAWYYLGVRLRERGDPEEALEAFRNAHSAHPSAPRFLAAYGQALLDAGQVDLAFQTLKAAGDAGGSPEPRMVLARLYQRRGAYHRAIEEWHRVLELDPKRAEAWYFLAFCHLQTQQVSQAVEAIERAVALAPTESRFQRLRGSIFAAKGDLTTARGCFEKAITLAPQQSRAYHDLANFLLTQSQSPADVDRAEAATQELARLEPEYGLIAWFRARIAVARKQWEPARRELEETIRLQPALDEAYFHLANVYHRLGRHQDGERHMIEYRRRGELTRKMDEVRIRIAMADAPELRFRLASLEREAGLLTQARQSVEQGLRLAPGSAKGQAELRAIERAARTRPPLSTAEGAF